MSTNNNLLLGLLKKPVKLLNKNGANICWWNSFAQLFAATNSITIINEMNEFIKKHDCINNNNNNNNVDNKYYESCWYCRMFKAFVAIMYDANNICSINFDEFLFKIPTPIVDPKNNQKLIYHPFYGFIANQQQDSFEGCNKWFEIIENMIPDTYNLFKVMTTSEIKCIKCNTSHCTDTVAEPTLSVEIDNKNIHSIQDAIDYFQSTELVDANCSDNKCLSKFGYKSIKLSYSSNYLIIYLNDSSKFMAWNSIRKK